MKQLKLRLPDDLHRRLVKDAKARGKSLNGWLVWQLESSLRDGDIRDGFYDVSHRLDCMETRVGQLARTVEKRIPQQVASSDAEPVRLEMPFVWTHAIV
jgi:hypothetical protein